MACCRSEYRDKVVILTRSLAAADATGEQVESWPDPDAGSGEHWAKIEAPSSGEVLSPVRQSFAGMRLRFRTLVTLEPVDKVRIKEFDEDYHVAGVHRERDPETGRWQTVCTLVG